LKTASGTTDNSAQFLITGRREFMPHRSIFLPGATQLLQRKEFDIKTFSASATFPLLLKRDCKKPRNRKKTDSKVQVFVGQRNNNAENICFAFYYKFAS
jgi:hypothetical protein